MLSAVTVAVLVTGAEIEAAAFTVTVAVCPFGSPPIEHETDTPAAQLPRVDVATTEVSPAGMLCVSTTPVASPGPEIVTTVVNVTSPVPSTDVGLTEGGHAQCGRRRAARS